MTTQGEIEVLLVEDNPSDVELTLRALQKRNLANRVVVARDGVEALQILEGPAPLPKVVLLDLKLPKLNGLEVLRRMKSDERTKRIPVVVLTSSHEEPDVEESYRLGVNSYVVKPVDFESFATAVAEVGLYWLLLNHPPE
ncbi:MAG: two-component system response regulator [Gemmatimonadetes bacterium 13_1_40CM_3_70_6]|nr:MAG: two-component system response regulator [Gemmatimonadetes bacterium 13_1_40CM_3_70_6]